jgi:hypothetical protein
VHDAVGAYVLGVLDDADATAFEAHLAGCDRCAAQLEEFSGMEPMLALLADGPGRFTDIAPLSDRGGQDDALAPGVPAQPTGPGAVGDTRRGDVFALPTGASPSAGVGPSPHLLDRLIDEVAANRARRRRRSFYLAAAAAVLIIGGPTAAVVGTSGDGRTSTSQVAEAGTDSSYFKALKTKFSATDPATKVSATVGLERKAWGTSAVMELKNVKGPLKCRLVAVSKSGEQQVVTSWSVPAWGYGIADSPHDVARQPLYVHGGAAVQPNDIDHFVVTTFDGKKLVQVPA